MVPSLVKILIDGQEEITSLNQQLQRLAYYDPLTDLPNRTLFLQRLHESLADPATWANVTLLFIDLDDFKAVNDSLGHKAGDQVLTLFAARLQALGLGEAATRLGGDEFAILLLEDADGTKGSALAERLRALFQEPFLVEDREIRITVSIGVARASARANQAVELLRRADDAMYQAKRAGKAGWAEATPPSG